MPSARFALVALLFSCQVAAAQGNYREVTENDVVAMKLNHYFTADRKAHDPDFVWTFTPGEFVLKDGTGTIPAYLHDTILPRGRAAREIKGSWKLKDGRLVLTGMKADGRNVVDDASFPIYRTAPTVIRVGDVQHVFGLSP